MVFKFQKGFPVLAALCISIFFGLLTQASAQKAASGVSPAVKQAIQSAYNAQNAAFARQDIEGYLRHRAPDYVIANDHSEGDGEQKLRSSYGIMFPGTHQSSAKTTILSAVARAGGVVVTTKEIIRMVVVRPGDRQVGHIAVDNQNRDFWIKTASGWQEKRTNQLTLRQTVNGQPLH